MSNAMARAGRPPGRQRCNELQFRLVTGICLGILGLSALSGCSTGLRAGADDHGDTRDRSTLIQPGTPVSGVLETVHDVDYFKVAVDARSVRIIAATDAAASVAPVVTIEDLDEPATSAGHVVWGNLPSPRPAYVHLRVSGQPTRYELAVSLVAAAEPELGDAFEIELRYLGTEPSESQQAALKAAADFWEAAIVSGLPDLPIPTSDWKCEEDDPSLFGEYVDDLLILVRVEELDGANGSVAQSTICTRRAVADGGLPFLGMLTLDSADVESLETHGYLQRLAMRQIALVLGFGLLWDEQPFNFLQSPSVATDGMAVAGRDTAFAGPEARAAFAEIGGGYAGAVVPVENDTAQYRPGALDLHWRESVFGSELMSTVMESAAPPVSKVTLASLVDLGYEIDYAVAEPYPLPAPNADPDAASVLRIGAGGGGLRKSIAVAELPAGLTPFVNGY